jgi:hypothetical protein
MTRFPCIAAYQPALTVSGETFLGAWRVWNNYAFRSGETLPAIKRVGFTQQYSPESAPPEAEPREIWHDKAGANIWFTSKFL